MKNNMKYLLALFVILLIISYLVLNNNSNQSNGDAVYLIPELKSQINNVDNIVISKNDQKVSLSKSTGIWRIAEANNYLADANKIANLLLDLRKLKLKERKTSKPDNYAKLSLENSGDNAASQLKLKYADKQFADISIGKKSSNSQGIFVKKADDNQVWLSEGTVNVNLDPNDWIVSNIIDVNVSNIKSVTFESQKDSFTIDKITPQDEDFGLVNIPDNMQLKPNVNLSDLANGLQKFTIESASLRQNELSEPDLRVTYQLFSGMQYLLNISDKDDAYLMTIDLINADAVGENDKELKHWTYVIAQYKFDALNKKLSEIIEPMVTAEESGSNSDPNSDE